MQRETLPEAEQYTKKNHRRRIWHKIVSLMAGVVVFCTTYALILPAITQENSVTCNMEEHTHSEACYKQVQETSKELICSPELLETHVHDDSCYEIVETEIVVEQHIHEEACYVLEQGEMICQVAEEAAHTHADACFGAGTDLVCTIAENHTHADTCYEVIKNLNCELAEDETHLHSEECYSEENNLLCTETEGHNHVDSCYNTVLICQITETAGHQHDKACYEWENVLVCDKEEKTTAGETIITEEKVLICKEPEVEKHTHSESCFQETVIEEEKLTCTLEENEEHTHTSLCYGTWELICELQEHTHDLVCYSDSTADLETAEIWESTFTELELTGIWADDIVAIAESQLGYIESTKNYIVLEDGETVKGITRYGQWYGDPYGDWCAMFASFCLDYAGVQLIPLESNCENWIEALSEQKWDLFRIPDDHVPQKGELIFFDTDLDGVSDHVGIVTDLVEEEEGAPLKVKTIEGNSSNRVQYAAYELADATILGYGILPTQLTDEEMEQVNRVIEMIDSMPSADEINAKLAEYEELEDYEGEEAWYTEVCQQIAEAYYYYSELTDYQKKYVTNADKLLELEYIWSAQTLVYIPNKIDSAAVSTTDYAPTSEFVELNVFDYYGSANTPSGMMDINYRWKSIDKEYPGYQWNAGAYPYRYYSNEKTSIDSPYGWIANRNLVDCIDFGNSLITDYVITDALYEPDQKTGASGGTYYFAGDASKSRISVASSSGANGAINAIDWGKGNGNTDRPVGYTSTFGLSVSSILGSDGYPELKESAIYGKSLKYLFYDDLNNNFVYADKKNSKSVDGLFQQDPVSGEYYYDSRDNHAQYDDANDQFVLYDQIITPNFILYPFGNFLPFTDITNENNITQVKAFDYQGGVRDYIQTIINRLEALPNKNLSQTQLIRMLISYSYNWQNWTDSKAGNGRKWDTITAANAINDYFNNSNEFSDEGWNFETNQELQNLLTKLYNIDFDVAKNFFFGMEMKMNFMMPKDGMTGNDTNQDGKSDYPMEFYFAGDDDVWVYIDGILFLDLTGIHRHVGGKIDYVNGMVHYYQMESYVDGAVSDSPYYSMTFADILTELGGISESDLGDYLKYENGKYTTFKDYTTHSFNFYYMERGSGSSVCRINFNFPMLKKNSISVTKELSPDADVEVLGDPDYYFNIVTPSNTLFVGPNSETGVTSFTILDSGGTAIGTGETDEYGIFTLKAGQTAVFEGINENEGKFFVQELIKETDNDQYGSLDENAKSNVYVNGALARYRKLVDWSYRNYFTDSDSDVYTGPYGYRWYAYSGEDTDSSANSSFFFEADNGVKTSSLGNLSIAKKIENYNEEVSADKTFKMYVILGTQLIPVGTQYSVKAVDGTVTEKSVTEKGCIEIQAGETATISNLLSGTEFTVSEDSDSSKGYTVIYEANGAENVTTDGSSISGIIRVNANVAVTVTNAENGATVSIPVNKSFKVYDHQSHTYKFLLEQVADNQGTALTTDGTKLEEELLVDSVTGNLNFALTYLKHNFTALPQTLYYRITESVVDEVSMDNSQEFIAEIKVSEKGNEIEATLEQMWVKDADGKFVEHTSNSADFINTLTGNLKLQKIVDGGTAAQNSEFSFTIKLTEGSSGVTLPAQYEADLQQADGTIQTQSVSLDSNGEIKFTGVKHNESVKIYGIPIGAKWEIVETETNGFIVSSEVKNTETTDGTVTKTEGATVNGAISSGTTEVVYTNLQTYVLPDTGGDGTFSYTMAGLLLMLCSMAYLLYRLKKRRREVDGST